MTTKLEKKLTKLPSSPGVYLHKNRAGEIIYVGKAANLRSRVRQYFQKSRGRDNKTEVLVSEIVDIDWIELASEADALFVEAELIRRYLPPYNILSRDDKSLSYVRIDYKSSYPTVTMVRRPLDDGAQYFGPYLNGFAVKKALRFLRRAFPYASHKPIGQKRVSLHYHLGLDPGLEEGRTNLKDYRANLNKLMRYLRGDSLKLVREIERDMKRAAKTKDFESATTLRNQLQPLQQLSRQLLFSDRELMDASRDQAMLELSSLLGLDKPPRRIECFDISHIQGTDTVASMVVFVSGVPDKASYRKFKMRLAGNDDFAHIYETLSRRLRVDNRKKWGLPDLIVIDGGKGQLSAGIHARDEAGLQNIPTIGLAKRQEEIIIHKNSSLPGASMERIKKQAQKMNAYISESGDFLSIKLPADSNAVKLLQRIRDESHRFAISYHNSLKRVRQTASLLDEIPGVGPISRKKLIRHFGSMRGVMGAKETELQKVLGKNKGSALARNLIAVKNARA